MINIKDIASELKEFAVSEPCDISNVIEKGNIPSPKYARDIEHDGYDLRLMFTVNQMMGMTNKHFSIGTRGSGLRVPDRITEQFVPLFFDDDEKYFEMPSLLHREGTVRQFASKPKKKE
jgi:hypothetical protein